MTINVRENEKRVHKIISASLVIAATTFTLSSCTLFTGPPKNAVRVSKPNIVIDFTAKTVVSLPLVNTLPVGTTTNVSIKSKLPGLLYLDSDKSQVHIRVKPNYWTGITIPVPFGTFLKFMFLPDGGKLITLVIAYPK